MAVNFQIRGIYNFEVYPVAILGSDFKNVTILSIMDRETANREIDTQALHVNLYPYLPVGTPNNPNGYDYIKIKTSTGQTTILGIAWINLETITLVESRIITVKIGNVSAADTARVRNALAQNGFTVTDISIT